jgi:hypothetical protein
MIKQVLLAPVPLVHLESATMVPSLMQRVAFGSSRLGFNFPMGISVFIYASPSPHALLHRKEASWTGVLGDIVPANETGRRSGKHPDPSVRPPSTEATDGSGDTAFLFFWEILNLHRLEPPRPLRDFKSAFHGEVPKWPVLAELDC